MSTQPESPNRNKPSPLHWLGSLVLTLGATLAAVFITRQVKEAGVGHTYYEFIGGGVLLAVIGVVIIVSARHKSQ